MNRLTPEETLRHIHYKMGCGELRADVAERMLELFHQEPSLDYAQLQTAALLPVMPTIAFHTSSPANRNSIAVHGLRSGRPAEAANPRPNTGGQPAGVYVSVEPDEYGRWADDAQGWDIWAIHGADALPHRQDPLNPDCLVIECDVPPERIVFCGTASLDAARTHLFLPAA